MDREATDLMRWRPRFIRILHPERPDPQPPHVFDPHRCPDCEGYAHSLPTGEYECLDCGVIF